MISLTIKTNTKDEADLLLDGYNYEYFTRKISYDTGEEQEIEGEEVPVFENYEGFFTKIIVPVSVDESGFLSDYWVTNETTPSLDDLKWKVSGIADYNE